MTNFIIVHMSVTARGFSMSLCTKVGLYYEGFVDNLEDMLEGHRRCTMTSYGTRSSKIC